jgi:nitric oxide reductase NorD protein
MKRPAAQPNQALASVLPDRPELTGTLELVWRQAQRTFRDQALTDWLAICRQLADSGLGTACTLAFLRNGPACAALVGADATFELGRTGIDIGRRAGARAALALFVAAPKAARILANAVALWEWQRVMRQLAEFAPESVPVLLDRIEGILNTVDVRAFEAWVLGGVHSTADDPERRLKYFALADPLARRSLARGASAVAFADVERRMKAYVVAMWGLRVPIRAAVAGSGDPPVRASFESGFIRVPDAFRGVSADAATQLYRAALAHIAAHLRYGRGKLEIGTLKPVQVALVSLIEDARVEQLAIRAFPGLRRLWLPFHTAEPSGPVVASGLFARLARALLDQHFRDDNEWVRKGSRLFFGSQANWDDPAMSRAIGGMLGNDLGQMRVQFNMRTYVVEPAYRDDNAGVWELPEHAQGLDSGTLYESVRFEQIDDATPPDREGETKSEAPDRPNRAAAAGVADGEAGIPVARYPEWDYLISADRTDWTTLVEFMCPTGSSASIEQLQERYREIVDRLAALIRSAKVSRPVRLHRQPEGDRLDLDACIVAAVAKRAGDTPDPRVYTVLQRRHRDLSVLVLLDVSASTNDVVRGSERTVLALERDATALLARAMAGLGDPFAIRAFCSNGRENVRYYRVKDFADPFDALVIRRLAGLNGSLSTRIGAALRHAGHELGRQLTHRRLLLVVTDGEPWDIDVGDRRYLIEDARKAVMSLRHGGIDVFCVGLDSGGDSYLTRIFGRPNVVQIDRLERMPEKLPMLYLRLTA